MQEIQRYFPKGAIKVRPKQLEVEIGLYQTARPKGGLYYGFISYSGKRSKPDVYERCTSLESRERRINEYLERVQNNLKWKAERKAAQVLKNNPVKVGDLFYTSWGYDQTNCEFFQVVEVKGQFAHVREIGSAFADGGKEGGMSSNVVARPDAFLENSKVLRKRIQTHDGGASVHLKISDCRTAWQWDGRPKYSSWYA